MRVLTEVPPRRRWAGMAAIGCAILLGCGPGGRVDVCKHAAVAPAEVRGTVTRMLAETCRVALRGLPGVVSDGSCFIWESRWAGSLGMERQFAVASIGGSEEGKLIRDVIRAAARHNAMSVPRELASGQRSDGETAFLLLSLCDYETGRNVLGCARSVLKAGRSEDMYLICASLKVAAYQGNRSDLALVQNYLGHSDPSVRSMAQWTNAVMESLVHSDGREEDEPTLPRM